MNIRNIRALQGPNYWSHKLPVIVMELDLEDLETKPTNTIVGFKERLHALMPSLYEHKCSEGKFGGFYFRVEEGTWMGHVIEHIAIELQVLAGMYCPFGKTRGTGETGVYNVIIEYLDQEAGFYAAEAAVRIAQAVIDSKDYDIVADIKNLSEIWDKNKLGPSTQAIIQEAQSRDIPWYSLDGEDFITLGYGKWQKRITAALTSSTSCIGVDIAGNKDLTKRMLQKACIPVPEGFTVSNLEQLYEAADKLGYPLVVKPIDGNHGREVSIDINSKQELTESYKRAKECSRKVIVEKMISGYDFRMLIVDYKFVAATKRIPAQVVGDGVKTIQQLVEQTNSDPSRGAGHARELTNIVIDDYALSLLAKQGLTLKSIPCPGEEVRLKATANLSTGGTGVDITESVHPYNIFLAERAARIIGLDICGLDIMAPCLTMPIKNNGGAVMEVNAEPGLRMHHCPSEGSSRNVAKPILDMTFPDNHNGRIPITAITGTNGKTTTTRLIAHLATVSGYHTGLTTSDGIYNNGKIIEEGDCTGPNSAQLILSEPDVDFAVLECARGGILRAGLGFDKCDIGIITNISEDHVGIDGIQDIDQMARVKGVVANSISPSGYAILNADDERVFELTHDLTCNIALFGMSDSNPKIIQHYRNGGVAAFIQNGNIIIQEGGNSAVIAKTADIPLTYDGKAVFNIQNIMAACLAGYLHNMGIQNIREGLFTFLPTSSCLPGRMNLFKFPTFEVLVDYAHNPTAIKELGKYLKSIDAARKIGIVTAVGDRRKQDIINVGVASAQVFDEIIIKHDDDLRGRTREEITGLITQGIREVDDQMPIKVISEEHEAVKHAIAYAEPGTFITALCADVPAVLSQIEELLENKVTVPLVS